MRAYAEGTQVSAQRSQFEIMEVLTRFGVTKHAVFNDGGEAAIVFYYAGLTYRIGIVMPDPSHEAFHYTDSGRARKDPKAAHAAETRRRWRSLLAVIKAKLVAVDDGITTFESEFMAHIVVSPDQRTVGDVFLPKIKEAGELGFYPQLALPGGGR